MMNRRKEGSTSLDLPVFLISGGLLIAFVVIALINADFVSGMVDYLFGLSVTYFGVIYQFLMIGTFIIALFLAFSKYGKIKLGKLDKPEMSNFKWISIRSEERRVGKEEIVSGG